MEIELIKKYALGISEIFAEKTRDAKRNGQTQDYIKYVEEKHEFWGRIAQLPSDSEYWALVKRYFSLQADPKACQVRRRTAYKFLRERGL